MATIRQKKAIKKTLENSGNVSKAMLEAGYSPSVAKTPSVLTGSKAWKEMMEEILPEELILNAHKELLNAHHLEHMVFPSGIKKEGARKLLEESGFLVKKLMVINESIHVWFWTPDNNARKNGVDMAHKLRGSYKNEDRPPGDVNIIVKYELPAKANKRQYSTKGDILEASEQKTGTFSVGEGV